MYFDDGSDPYIEALDQVTVLKAVGAAHLTVCHKSILFCIVFITKYIGISFL